MLVDSHCHLDRLKLDSYPNGLDDALAAAQERGVTKMLCVCISEDNKDRVLAIARQFNNVYASVGVHPSDVDDLISVETLVDWSQQEKVIALGETGLDYYYSAEKAELQKQSFKHHLLAGKQTGLPVIVHTRDAREDTIALLREFACPDASGVMHCFTESWDMAQQALDLNFYISISGIVTFKNADALREVTRKIPIDRLLIETDSPYLAPVPHRGKSNEPKFVRDVAEYVAQLRGLSLETLAEQTSNNFSRLFKA